MSVRVVYYTVVVPGDRILVAIASGRGFTLPSATLDDSTEDYALGFVGLCLKRFGVDLNDKLQVVGRFDGARLMLSLNAVSSPSQTLPPGWVLAGVTEVEQSLWSTASHLRDAGASAALSMAILYIRQHVLRQDAVSSTTPQISLSSGDQSPVLARGRSRSIAASGSPTSTTTSSQRTSIPAAVRRLRSVSPTASQRSATRQPPQMGGHTSMSLSRGIAETSVAYYCDFTEEELSRAAYESLLCAMRSSEASVHSAIAIPDHLAKIMELMRIRLGFSKARHARLHGLLARCASQFPQISLSSLWFRLVLLTHCTQSDFNGNAEEMADHQRRQASVLINGLGAFLETVPRAGWIIPPSVHPASTLQDVLAQATKLCEELIDGGAENEDYDQLSKEISDLCRSLLTQVDETNKTSYSRSLQIAYRYPLNVDIYEQLIGVCWIREGEGGLHPKHADVMRLLASIQSPLHISELLHSLSFARMVFLQYKQSNRSEILLSLRDDRPFYPGLKRLLAKTMSESDEQKYQRSVLMPLRDELRSKLYDYHGNFAHDPKKMNDFLTTYIMLLTPSIPVTQIKSTLPLSYEVTNIIVAGIGKFYERMTSAYTRPMSVADLKLLAGAILEEVHGEKKYYTPFFAVHHPAPLATTLRAFATRYLAEIECSLYQERVLTVESAELFRIVDKLGKAMAAQLQCDTSMLETHAVLVPLLRAWLQRLSEMLTQGTESAISCDSFESLAGGEGNSTSVVDLFAMVLQTLPLILSLPLASASTIICEAVAVVCKAVTQYAERLIKGQLDPDALIPPLPPWKKPSPLRGRKTPPPTPSLDRLPSVKILCVRLSNIAYALRQLASLREFVTEHIGLSVAVPVIDSTTAALPQVSSPPPSPLFTPTSSIPNPLRSPLAARPPLSAKSQAVLPPLGKSMSQSGQKNGSFPNTVSGADSPLLENPAPSGSFSVLRRGLQSADVVFVHTQQVLDDTRLKIADLLAARIVFLDLRSPLCDFLYLPSVQANRVVSVLKLIDGIVSSMLDTLKDEIAATSMFRALLQRLLQAFERIVMFGGFMRKYDMNNSQTHDMIQEDLNMIQDFFSSTHLPTGKTLGLPAEEVRNMSRHVQRLVSLLMIYDPHDLIRLYESGPGEYPLTKQNILCVLRHFKDGKVKEFVASQRKLLKQQKLWLK